MSVDSTVSDGGNVDVLLVEDDPLARLTGRRSLETLGHHVMDVGTCADAERAWRASEFNIVVSDYRLPDGLCVSMVDRMRQSGYRQPVICITAENECLSEAECHSLGISEVVAKPVDMETLRSAVAKALRIASGGSVPVASASDSPERVGRFLLVSCPETVDADAMGRIEELCRDEAWLALDMSGTDTLENNALPVLAEACANRRREDGRLCLLGIHGGPLKAFEAGLAGTGIDVVPGRRALAAMGRRLSSQCERAEVLNSVVVKGK